MSINFTILGSGSWGTAFAQHLASAPTGSKVGQIRIWGNDFAVLEEINLAHTSSRYLPGVKLSEKIRAEADLRACIDEGAVYVLAVPSHVAAEVLKKLAATLGSGKQSPRLLSLVKGFDPGTKLTVSGLAAEILPGLNFSVLSGPSFALEVAEGKPTAVVLANSSLSEADSLRSLIHFGSLRVYTSTDVIGVELGGSLKNVIALAVGIVDGLGIGQNARAALITRGLAEIRRLARSFGADPVTISGLSGLGDLTLTCLGDLSRNRRCGLRLGAGEELANVLAEIGQVVEGVSAAKQAKEIALAKGVDCPIIAEVHAILNGEVTARDSLVRLLSREAVAENR